MLKKYFCGRYRLFLSFINHTRNYKNRFNAVLINLVTLSSNHVKESITYKITGYYKSIYISPKKDWPLQKARALVVNMCADLL